MNFFNQHQQVFTGKAPGRLDVMGGIADYSGSLVLQMPISEQATVQAAFRSDGLLRVFSADEQQHFECSMDDLPTGYEEARRFFAKKESDKWAAYVVGCLLVLAKEKGAALRGIDFFVQSEVPIGKGVSSSAALEIATLRALAQLYALDFEGTEMALLAQKAENLIVGSPCGLMDQLASCFGEKDCLLPIRCQPDLLHDTLKIPQGIAFVGMDSGVRHAVSGASYTDVRTAAFMGYSIIAQAAGCSIADIRQARLQGSAVGLPFDGYLCNILPAVFEKKYAALLPDSMSGEVFLEQFGGITDPVTQVESQKNYQINHCTRHPIYENFRVQTFASLLQQAPLYSTLELMGELMFQSHESYTACGLGNKQTDDLVERVRSAGNSAGVVGAKITGGGSGGTVCVLCYGEVGLETARRIFEEYRQEWGKDLKFIH